MSEPENHHDAVADLQNAFDTINPLPKDGELTYEERRHLVLCRRLKLTLLDWYYDIHTERDVDDLEDEAEQLQGAIYQRNAELRDKLEEAI